MLKRLGFDDSIPYTRISDYELGERVPPLPIVLEYARVAGVHLEDLVDDKLSPPDKLPGKDMRALKGNLRELAFVDRTELDIVI